MVIFTTKEKWKHLLNRIREAEEMVERLRTAVCRVEHDTTYLKSKAKDITRVFKFKVGDGVSLMGDDNVWEVVRAWYRFNNMGFEVITYDVYNRELKLLRTQDEENLTAR